MTGVACQAGDACCPSTWSDFLFVFFSLLRCLDFCGWFCLCPLDLVPLGCQISEFVLFWIILGIKPLQRVARHEIPSPAETVYLQHIIACTYRYEVLCCQCCTETTISTSSDASTILYFDDLLIFICFPIHVKLYGLYNIPEPWRLWHQIKLWWFAHIHAIT